MTCAGDLNKSIVIKSPTRSQATQGGETTSTWGTTVATVFAKIKPMKTQVVEQAAVRNPRITHEVIIRFRSDVDTTNRFEFGSTPRVFNILGVRDEDEKNEFLICECEENK